MATETRFHYKARKLTGQLVKGDLVAGNKKSAEKEIKNLGLIPIEVVAEGAVQFSSLKDITWQGLREAIEKVPTQELMMFTQQLQTLFSVGVPILQGLKLIIEQTEHPTLKRALKDVRASLDSGSNLADAFAKHPRIFNDIYVNMIRVGETSGRLEQVLERLYEVIESQAENKAKIKSALFYPKMVFGMIGVTLLVLLNVIIPKMKGFYSKMGAGELPLPTRIVIGASDFVTGNIIYLVVIAMGLWWWFYKWSHSEKGRIAWDNFKLKIPVIGNLLVEIEMNSFCIILEMMLLSGVGLVQSLKVLKGTLSNHAVIYDVETCRQDLISGGKMGSSLEKSPRFPNMLAGLIGIGEEAGSIEVVLRKMAKHYQQQINHKLDNLSKAIEPIMLAIIFSIVIVLALAIFLPIWQMSSALKK